MQSVSSRIWTCVAVFISYDDNNYTTGTSIPNQIIEVIHMDCRAVLLGIAESV